jgi:hypothetical protein
MISLVSKAVKSISLYFAGIAKKTITELPETIYYSTTNFREPQTRHRLVISNFNMVKARFKTEKWIWLVLKITATKKCVWELLFGVQNKYCNEHNILKSIFKLLNRRIPVVTRSSHVLQPRHRFPGFQ